MTLLLPLLLSLVSSATAASCDAVAAMRSAPFGYQLMDRSSDTLRTNYGTTFDVTLERGHAYRIIACGSDGTRDIDLRLYDDSYNLIDQDRLSDNLPEVDVSPRWTGQFHVKVEMYRASATGDYVLYLYRR